MRINLQSHRKDLAASFRDQARLNMSGDWNIIARNLCERAMSDVTSSNICSMLRLVVETLDSWERKNDFSRAADPEIFLCLYVLTKDEASEYVKAIYAALLLIHCGLVEPNIVPEVRFKFLRLVHSRGQVLYASGGHWSNCTSVVAVTPDLHPLRVLMPANGLFNDCLPYQLYPSYESESGYFDLDRVATVESAVAILKLYSLDLYVNFFSKIRTIALTPPLVGQPRRSFSCRLSYYGGIFLDVIPNNVVDTTVNLLHEYCHQQLWSLWFVNPRLAVEGRGAVVRSPFTGRDIPAAVMAQAYLIYSAVLDFLRWSASSNICGIDTDKTVADIENIACRLPILRSELTRSLGFSSPLRELLTFCDQTNNGQV